MIQTEALWNRLKSNPTYAAISSAFLAAVANELLEEAQSGKLDLSREGLHRLVVSSAVAAFVAYYHLRLPSPGQLNPPGVAPPLPSPSSESNTTPVASPSNPK